MKIKKIIKLRVLLVLLGIIAITWSVLCMSGIRTCIGITHPELVTGKDSSALRAGNVVCIEFDYIFEEGLITGFAFGPNHYYEIIKIKGKDEFVFCTLIGDDTSYLDGKPYFNWFDDVKEYESEEKYLFLGKVLKMNESIKGALEHNCTKVEETIYKHPNTLNNTNFDYYIQYIEPEEEVDRLMGRATFWGLLIVSWLCLFKKLQQEQKAYIFFLNEERMNEKIRHQMKVEKQIKEFTGLKENVDDDFTS